MKKMRYINMWGALRIAAVFLVVLLCQTPVHAATNCIMASTGAPDKDCDGLSDTEEASPIAGVTTNPGIADLFVILQPASSGSLFPSLPLNTLKNSAGLINLTVRQIAGPVSGVRNVTSTQKAIKVQESLYVGTFLGDSPQGSPNTIADTGASVIYTQKITNTVAALCTPAGKVLACKDARDSAAITQSAVIANYIRHTIAHEASHQLNLKYTCDSTIGCHYSTITSATQTPTIMDQTVFYVKGTKGVTWYIGSIYNSADANLQLR